MSVLLMNYGEIAHSCGQCIPRTHTAISSTCENCSVAVESGQVISGNKTNLHHLKQIRFWWILCYNEPAQYAAFPRGWTQKQESSLSNQIGACSVNPILLTKWRRWSLLKFIPNPARAFYHALQFYCLYCANLFMTLGVLQKYMTIFYEWVGKTQVGSV